MTLPLRCSRAPACVPALTRQYSNRSRHPAVVADLGVWTGVTTLLIYVDQPGHAGENPRYSVAGDVSGLGPTLASAYLGQEAQRRDWAGSTAADHHGRGIVEARAQKVEKIYQWWARLSCRGEYVIRTLRIITLTIQSIAAPTGTVT